MSAGVRRPDADIGSIGARRRSIAAKVRGGSSTAVLRDLGGLERRLDEMTPSNGREAGDGGTGPDAPALRAEIARRAAGCVRGRKAA